LDLLAMRSVNENTVSCGSDGRQKLCGARVRERSKKEREK